MESTSRVAAMAGALALSGMLGIGSGATFAQATNDSATSAPALTPPAPSLYLPTSTPATRPVGSTSVSANGTTGLTSAPPLATRRPSPSLTNRAAMGYGTAATPRGATASSNPYARSSGVANDPSVSTSRYSPSDAYPASLTGTAGANSVPTTTSPSYAASYAAGPAGANTNMAAPSNDPGYTPAPTPTAGAIGANPTGPGSEYWASSTPPPPQRKPSRLRRFFSLLDYRNREEADTETSASSYRDPSTGLNNPIAKPWLQHYNDQSFQSDN